MVAVIVALPWICTSLAKETKDIAKSHYQEWRHPRVHSNILDLPDDILSEIAEFTILTGALDGDPLAPLPLSHVCRRFRSIVIGTSKFWTTITTDLGLKLNKKILKRSKKQHLNVFCECLGLSLDLFDHARFNSARWKSFKLVVGRDSRTPNIPILRKLPSLDLANLESICLVYAEPTHSGYKVIDNNVHRYGKLRAPKLTHLVLVNVVPQPFARKPCFTLTKLTLSFISSWQYMSDDGLDHSWNFMRLLRFLDHTKTLEEFNLTLRVHELEFAVLPPTALPHITRFSLRIEDTASHIIDPFLRAILLPNLRALSFALLFSREGGEEEEHGNDGDDIFALDPWTRETCAVNLYLGSLFLLEEHFSHLTELELDVQIDSDLRYIKDNFHIPFHRTPKLERLHVKTNRNVFAPKPHQLESIPEGGIPLKELKLTKCESMKNLTWLRSLSECMNQRTFEKIVVDGDLLCSRGTVESLEKFFPLEKIDYRESELKMSTLR